MRIAIFTDTFIPEVNGVTHTFNQFLQYLQNSEHEFVFLVPEYSKQDPIHKSIWRYRSVPFILYNEVRIAFPNYFTARQKLDDFKPDIVHVATPIGIGHVGLRYAKDRGIPAVASFHTHLDSYLKYYNLEHFEKYLWHFFRYFHSQFAVNFCPSTDTKKHLEKRGINDVKIWTRGIDINHFSPDFDTPNFFDNYRGYQKTAKLTCLYAGRVAAEKDLDILFKAINKLNQTYQDDIEFIIVGDGPEKENLTANRPNNVYFTGFLKGDALSKAYASADVFTFPSSTETLGNVVLEAMASGTPVIAVKSGGITDNVFNGYNGLLAKPRDAKDFAAKIESVILDQTQLISLRDNALTYVKEKSWKSIFDKLIDDYRIVIDNKQGEKRETA